MKRLLLGLLLLLSGSTAWAQQSFLSPTINYQGRANDGTGPVTGQNQVTLTIYDAETGGNALFTETHTNVNFSDAGIFTVVIGGATPGGIPLTAGFNQPRWLGVTISGFNNGNEIPRLRFHGSPYSIVSGAAQIADSSRIAFQAIQALSAEQSNTTTLADSSRAAFQADRAGEATTAETALMAETLTVPAILDHDGDEPVLTLIGNSGKGTGLVVEGKVQVNGEINSSQICGTSEHFVAGGSSGDEGTPVPGGFYHDNAPIAWGQILPDGSLLGDFGIKAVTHSPNNPGVFIVELDNSLAVDEFNRPQFSVVVTPRTQAEPTAQPVFGTWDYAIDGSTNQPLDNSVEIFIRNLETGVDIPFSVVVFGRPAK